jgi:hypothetical protein
MKINTNPSQQFRHQEAKLKTEIKKEISKNAIFLARLVYLNEQGTNPQFHTAQDLYKESKSRLKGLVEAENKLHSSRIYDPSLGQITKNLGKRLAFASRGLARLAVGIPVYTAVSVVTFPALIGTSMVAKIAKSDQWKTRIKYELFVNEVWHTFFKQAQLDIYRSQASEADGITQKRRDQLQHAHRQSLRQYTSSKRSILAELPEKTLERVSTLPPVLPEIHLLTPQARPKARQQNVGNVTGYDSSQVRFSRMGLTEAQLPSQPLPEEE